ncbi:methylamine utilization protein MauG [Oleiphilus messinensis]|uniref:Methylamine utilization protein MauG n=1 Tax=Oleiphilus messinensis TaxID=141451 RepID=A0A1Y0I3I0_9GAMM|nr:ABC transporter substrate-binding protein [Oleiphilus messinensis]ARU54971.1 methylamine utilization protein MauG [Oleiphilus messinensis]
MHRQLRTILAGVLFSMLSWASLANEIVVGMSTALSGPASQLGLGVKQGVDALFNRVNKDGGVQGKKLKLIALDDGYEPAKAAPNMRTLIEQNKVLAIIGNVGTPTAIVTVPIANKNKTLLFGAFTGAGVLRKSPPDRYIINYRASYAEETSAMIDGLLSTGIKPEEIAFFTQNDGYGDAGYQGAVEALQRHGFNTPEMLAHGRYTRNTLNVEDALSAMFDAPEDPRAIIMVGAYGPCAKFISLAKEEFPNAIFLNVSFVGSEALKATLGDKAEGVVVTQVVPHYDSEQPLITQYRNDLLALDRAAQPSFVSLEGYIAAAIFAKALTSSSAPLDRESIIDNLEQLALFDLGLGGTKLSLSTSDHQASNTIWPTIIRGGHFVPLNSWSDATTGTRPNAHESTYLATRSTSQLDASRE